MSHSTVDVSLILLNDPELHFWKYDFEIGKTTVRCTQYFAWDDKAVYTEEYDEIGWHICYLIHEKLCVMELPMDITETVMATLTFRTPKAIIPIVIRYNYAENWILECHSYRKAVPTAEQLRDRLHEVLMINNLA